MGTANPSDVGVPPNKHMETGPIAGVSSLMCSWSIHGLDIRRMLLRLIPVFRLSG
ncbi:unnamed protein product [Prunus armeniaca]